ncbi:NADH:riboflavin 5'-phosphate oxidoreductase [compost metagenome]
MKTDNQCLEEFKAIFRTHPAGVAVVTLNEGNRPCGFTATSVISVSASPPVIVFSVQNSSSSLPALLAAESLVIHFLDECHEALAMQFATPGIDRFSGRDWRRLESGEPLLVEVDTWARCTVIDRTQAGSSLLIQVRPENIAVGEGRTPIIYHDRTFCRVGDTVSLR